ncbi:anti-virulence regulator CigR family protein [Pseudomonas profundi]|uniref:anti-virulence regulator CigR family protein n=1 Tax=Pseudomonas profundi TaxID=1981513 RepID=UPI00123C295C|nr:anti-virulence regulator CigR family protein [Pseudomonas profundi]
MQRRKTVMTLFIAGSLFAITAQAAPPEGKGPKHKHSAEHAGQSGKGNSSKGQGSRDREDQHRDRDILDSLVHAGITATRAREYAHSAGFNGYAELPPGIRKNLGRGKPLPPGIAKKVQSGAFLDRLPQHSGYEWQTAGTELILVSVVTGVIADILYDVFD